MKFTFWLLPLRAGGLKAELKISLYRQTGVSQKNVQPNVWESWANERTMHMADKVSIWSIPLLVTRLRESSKTISQITKGSVSKFYGKRYQTPTILLSEVGRPIREDELLSDTKLCPVLS
jgi:hypothetical protein